MIFQTSLFNFFVIVLINSIGLSLAFWVWNANKKAKVNQLVLGWTIPILLMLDFGYLSNIPYFVQYALLLKRLRFSVLTLFFIAGYFFYIYFPKEGKRNRILDKVFVIIWAFLFYLSLFSPLIIANIKLTESGIDVLFGRGILVYYLITIFSIFLFLYTLFKKYFNLSKEEKLKVQYFLIGVALFAIFNFIFNIVIPILRGTMQYYQFGDYSLIFLLSFTAYAIVKRELFGIKVVLTTLFVGLIAILLALDLFVFTEKFWLEILKGFILVIFLLFGHYLIKSVQEEVKRREELEKLDKAKSEFISMASHQLRTPLTAIKGYISLLLEGSYGQVSERTRESLKKVFQSNERLIKIVNDLLDLSKIEVGKMELVKEPVQIEDLIQSCYDEMKEAVEKKGLKFIFQKPKELLPKLNIDPLKIKEVLLNLIDNASRYTQQGEIKIEVQKKNSKILISIKDSGEGLSKEEKEKIFEGFTRGSAGINLFIEGRGLGLYVAKKFLELHQAKIWAESPGKGQGSTFFVELPIK